MGGVAVGHRGGGARGRGQQPHAGTRAAGEEAGGAVDDGATDGDRGAARCRERRQRAWRRAGLRPAADDGGCSWRKKEEDDKWTPLISERWKGMTGVYCE